MANTILERIKESLKNQGCEVFEWDKMNPPVILPKILIETDSVVYKKSDRWFCMYIPKNPRFIVANAETMEEVLLKFNAQYKFESERPPDVIESERVYSMLKFEDVRTILWKLVSRLPEVDWVTAGAITSWGDTYGGEEVIEWLEPLLSAEQLKYDAVVVRDDIDKLIDKSKLGPLRKHLETERDRMDKYEVPGIEIKYVEDPPEVPPDLFSDTLREAETLISYSESVYIQNTQDYNVGVINELRDIQERIKQLNNSITNKKV